jgi:hypothetical protein
LCRETAGKPLLTGWSLVRIRPGEPPLNSIFDFPSLFPLIG